MSDHRDLASMRKSEFMPNAKGSGVQTRRPSTGKNGKVQVHGAFHCKISTDFVIYSTV